MMADFTGRIFCKKELNTVNERKNFGWEKKEWKKELEKERLIFVGLIGYAKSGKDTIAALLPGYKRIAFADALKTDILKIFADIIPPGAAREEWLEQNKEILRPLLVEYGRAKRAFNPMYWVERVAQDHLLQARVKGRFVFTDVRYPNEVAWLTGILNTKIFRIWRENIGPANQEEAQSINDILNGRPDIETIYNPEGQPEQAAARILEIVEAMPQTEKTVEEVFAKLTPAEPA